MRLTLIVVLVLVSLALAKLDKRQPDKKQFCVVAATGQKNGMRSKQRDFCVRPRGKSGLVEFCKFNGDDTASEAEPPAETDDAKEDAAPSKKCFAFRVHGVGLLKTDNGDVTGRRVAALRKWTIANPPSKVTFPAIADDSSEEGDDPTTISALSLTMEAQLKRPGGGNTVDGKVMLYVLVFTESGTIQWKGENIKVRKGMFKLTVDLDLANINLPNDAEKIEVAALLIGRGNRKPTPKAGKGNREFVDSNGDKFMALSKAGVWTGNNKPTRLDDQGPDSEDVEFDSGAENAKDKIPAGALQRWRFKLKKGGNRFKYIRFDPIVDMGADDEVSATGTTVPPSPSAPTAAGSTTSPATPSPSSSSSTSGPAAPSPSAAGGVGPTLALFLVSIFCAFAALL